MIHTLSVTSCRCAYQAKVMKTLLQTSKTMVARTGFKTNSLADMGGQKQLYGCISQFRQQGPFWRYRAATRLRGCLVPDDGGRCCRAVDFGGCANFTGDCLPRRQKKGNLHETLGRLQDWACFGDFAQIIMGCAGGCG